MGLDLDLAGGRECSIWGDEMEGERVEAEGGTRKAGRNGVVWSMFVRLLSEWRFILCRRGDIECSIIPPLFSSFWQLRGRGIRSFEGRWEMEVWDVYSFWCEDGAVSWFFFFGWVGFVAVSCSVYFGNSSFRCLLTWGVGGSREIQMLLSWCFEGLWTRWWIWLGDMMTLFSEWGRRERRRRAMMFSLKLNKINTVDM